MQKGPVTAISVKAEIPLAQAADRSTSPSPHLMRRPFETVSTMDNTFPSASRMMIAGCTVILLLSASAQAESLFPRLTRKDDMNAIRANGQVWTIHDLVDRRNLAPGRFDLHHQRLGSALRLGLDGLEARRALNPDRFDFFHPFLGYLLTDTGSGPGDVGGIGQPVPSPGLPDGDQTLPPPDPGFTPVPPAPPQPPIVPPTTPPEVLMPPPDANGEPAPPVIPPPPGDNELPPLAPPGPGPGPGPIDLGPDPTPPGETPQVIPEPAAMLQLVVGLSGLGGALAWRRHRHSRTPLTD